MELLVRWIGCECVDVWVWVWAGAYTDTYKKFAFCPKSWYYKNITFWRKTYHRHFCINKKITLDTEKQCYAYLGSLIFKIYGFLYG